VRRLRQRWGPRLALIGSGGVHEPEQALRLIEVGADLVQIESGLVYGGPGLPKRINEALLYAYPSLQPIAPVGQAELPAHRAPQQTWFWTTLLGAGMALGSALVLFIAATRVVLPYDEGFVGMSRAQLEGINPRLLAFMTHDRVTLAGTMGPSACSTCSCRCSACAAGGTGRPWRSLPRPSPGLPRSSSSWVSATSTRSTPS
jgi:hypothetical protein